MISSFYQPSVKKYLRRQPSPQWNLKCPPQIQEVRARHCVSKRNPLYQKGGEVGFSIGIVFGSNFK